MSSIILHRHHHEAAAKIQNKIAVNISTGCKYNITAFAAAEGGPPNTESLKISAAKAKSVDPIEKNAVMPILARLICLSSLSVME